MLPMPIADHQAIAEELAATGKYVKVLWQSEDTLMFIARGREYRSEFHINPSDEHMTMLKGTMNLHYRKPDGSEEIAVLKEGETIYTAAGIPHCDALIHEEFFVVDDYTKDPVSQAYSNFFDSLDARTCDACGAVHPGRD